MKIHGGFKGDAKKRKSRCGYCGSSRSSYIEDCADSGEVNGQ